MGGRILARDHRPRYHHDVDGIVEAAQALDAGRAGPRCEGPA